MVFDFRVRNSRIEKIQKHQLLDDFKRISKFEAADYFVKLHINLLL